MKRRNFFVALVCAVVSMLMLSSCGTMMDFLYSPYLLPPPPPHHHHYPPPPPPCYHHHCCIVNVDGDTTVTCDVAMTEISAEASVL